MRVQTLPDSLGNLVEAFLEQESLFILQYTFDGIFPHEL